MITIEVTQFIAPNGEQRQRSVELGNDCAAGYEALKGKGCRLTAEVLVNGMVSQCIEHEEGDYIIEITKNGPEVMKALHSMIRKFDAADFDEWLSCLNDGCEFDEDGIAF